MKCALIVGHGGSGTNWLLEIFDQSRSTFCANERNRIAQSLMSELPDPEIDCGQYAGVEDIWDWVADGTKHRFGERDPVSQSKDFLYCGLRGKLLYLIRSKRRLRELLSIFNDRLSGPEWQAPQLLVKQDRLDDALLVLKIIRCPALACWLLRHPGNEASVIHILRHPGGALDSWRRRLLNKRNYRLVGINNRNRLEAILRLDKNTTTSTRNKILDCLNEGGNDVFRSELLYWLYSNEKIHACGNERSNYFLVNYDALAKDPEGIARKVYSFLGLPLDGSVMEEILDKATNSLDISVRWKDSVSPEYRAMLESVLEGSRFESMWT